MGYVKRDFEHRHRLQNADKSPNGSAKAKQAVRIEELLDRVYQLAAERRYGKAIDLLAAVSGDRRIRDARGVCLLRLGRAEEAVRLYRELVLNPGCTWMRPDLPPHVKTNYATALLLSGRPSGCLEILAEVKDEQNATVQKLRAAIRTWEKGLTLWQKFNWRFGRIAPTNRPVSIDFEPGDFEPLPNRTESPQPKSPPQLPEAA